MIDALVINSLAKILKTSYLLTMHVENRKLSEIVPYARNPRKNSQAVSAVAGSLKEFGPQQPIVVDREGVIVVGHTRLLAAQQLGMEAFPVAIASELTPQQAKAYRLADNKTAERAEWDIDLLKLELDDLLADGVDLDITGFEQVELDDILAPDPVEGLTDPDDVPKLPDEAISVIGDVWVLGRHRLMCGDSTSEGDVQKLLDGKGCNVCLTDPPYGLGDTVSTKNDYVEYDDSPEALESLIHGFLPIARDVADVVVLTPGNANQRKYPDPTWTMAWFVPAGAGSGPWGFCCWQPIICYGKDPKLSKSLGCYPDAIVHHEKSEKNGHPCPKPVAFWSWLLERISEKGELVYDPFSGSGTTIISAEKFGRTCYAMEITPRYVDLAVRRWQEFTGENAVLERTGERFNGSASC